MGKRPVAYLQKVINMLTNGFVTQQAVLLKLHGSVGSIEPLLVALAMTSTVIRTNERMMSTITIGWRLTHDRNFFIT